MNLVKLQEELKSLPIGAIQQYANGANPGVPPYLAAAELQRRDAAMRQASNTQAAAAGPQPSVKEQLEQRLGLGALQAQQQQQAMQGIAQQGAQQPMPVPPGAPQPEAQPEPPMGMARGGVASLPVRDDMFAYADGGVVGFQAGGITAPRERQPGESFEAYRKRLFAMELEDQRRKNAELAAAKAAAYEAERQRLLQERGGAAVPLSPFVDRAPRPAPTAGRPDPSDARLMRGPVVAGITDRPPAAPTPKAPPPVSASGIAAALRPRAAAAAPAAAAKPAPMDLEALAEQSVREQLTEKIPLPTEQEAMASEGAFATQYGYDKPYGAEQRALMEQMRADYEKRKESRGLETLIATLGGFSRGYGGAGASYLDALNAQRAYDDDFARRMLEQTGALEGVDRETALGRGKAAMEGFRDRLDAAEGRRGKQRDVAGRVYELGKRADAAEELAKLRAELRPARTGGAAAPNKMSDVEKRQFTLLQNNVKLAQKAVNDALTPSAKVKPQQDLIAAQAALAQFMARLGAGGMDTQEAAPAAQSGTKATPASSGSWGAMKVN